jgi:hypothetical protein
VTEVLPRLTPEDPPGYRPIRWLWDYKVPQDPPYVPGTYRSVTQMDPGQMTNRLTSNVPFTKNIPLIGVNIACKTDDDCVDVGRAPGTPPLNCSGIITSNTAIDVGGMRCDVPLVRFGEFCAPGIAACLSKFDPNFASNDPMKPPSRALLRDEEIIKDLNAAPDVKSAVLGGYTCQPNTSQGGYCYMRCDSDAPASPEPKKATEKVMIKYKGPDGQTKTDPADLVFDARCGNLPGYKCLNPAGTVPTQMRVCLRQCDGGKPDTFNDVFCSTSLETEINEKVNGDIQKGLKCATRGLSGAAGCQWDPAYEPRDPKLNFTPL